MGIVDKQMTSPAAEQPQAAKQRRATMDGRDLLVAAMGALFDERTGGAEKVIAAAQGSRDPASVIAQSAYDVVLAVAEQINFTGPNKAAVPVVMMAFGQLAELADAAGIELDPNAAGAAVQALMSRINGEDERGEVGGQEPSNQAEDAAEGEQDDTGDM